MAGSQGKSRSGRAVVRAIGGVSLGASCRPVATTVLVPLLSKQKQLEVRVPTPLNPTEHHPEQVGNRGPGKGHAKRFMAASRLRFSVGDMRFAVSFIGLALALAGCLAPLPDAADQTETSAADLLHNPFGGWPDPLIVDHDHNDLGAHQYSTPTMQFLAHETFESLGVPSPIFGEVDHLGDDHLVVAAVLAGFYVVDIRDRAEPRPVSYTPLPGYVADVKTSESGNFVFVAVQYAGFTGLQAYNVRIKEHPILAGALPVVAGCHMIAVHESHVYCAPGDTTVQIFQYTEIGPAVTFEHVGTYAPKDAPVSPLVVTPGFLSTETTHDMTVQDDPLTGEAVMYVSFWDYGLRVVDVTDPGSPLELGAWTGEDAVDTYDGKIHTSMAALVEGRRVIATVPEYAHTPSVTFLDATDYGNLEVMGVWAPKGADEFGNDTPRRFSTHNFQFVNGRIYLAMYHGGVWVIDAGSADALRAPVALGYHLTAEGRLDLPNGRPAFTGPEVWDVTVKDGYTYATDIDAGLFTLHYAGDEAGNPAITSFA